MSLGSSIGSPRVVVFAHLILLAFLVGLVASEADALQAVPEELALTEEERAGPIGAALWEAQAAYRNGMTDGDLAGALEHAKTVVGYASEIWGPSSTQVSQSLTNLAIVQSELGDLVAAQQNFESAIQILEDVEGTLVSSELVNPLRGLAAIQVALNNFESAVPIYRRSIHISHVTAGPSNLQQVDDMDALSRAHYLMGDTRRASKIQDMLFRIQQRKFISSDNVEGYVDALGRRARWYVSVGDFTTATAEFRRLERIIGNAYGKQDVRLVPILMELSFVAANQATGGYTGLAPEEARREARRTANRAVRIARENSADFPELLPRTLTRQADFLLASESPRGAASAYREAQTLIAADAALAPLQEELYSDHVLIERRPIREVFHRNELAKAANTFPDTGFVEVTYDINTVGRPRRVRVVDSSPAGLMDNVVIRGVRSFVYRPVFEDGEPYVSTGHRYRHEFRYDESRLTDSELEYVKRTEALRESAAPDEPETKPAAEALQDVATDEGKKD